jgi:hypothetical protein
VAPPQLLDQHVAIGEDLTDVARVVPASAQNYPPIL